MNDNDQIKSMIKSICSSAAEFDYAGVILHWNDLKSEIKNQGIDVNTSDFVQMLGKLRSGKAFSEIVTIAEYLFEKGLSIPQARQHYAQALVELGKLSKAKEVVQSILGEDPPKHSQIYTEAMGLLGRIYKQKYVNGNDSDDPELQSHLKQSIDHYSKPYHFDKTANTFHGINLVALLARAERDGISLTSASSYGDLAQEILATIATMNTPDISAWEKATAAEAYIALGDWDRALHWLKQFVASQGYDAFSLNSFIRQLKEVWQITKKKTPSEDDNGSGEGGLGPENILEILQAILLRLKEYGEVELDQYSFQSLTNLNHEHAEALLGTDAPRTMEWWETGREAAKSVCLIKRGLGQGVGTGFLVKGAEISQTLDDKLYVLTNAHVVSDNNHDHNVPNPPLRSHEASVDFTLLNDHDATKVKNIIRHSPRNLHDATLLELETVPANLRPLTISQHLPLRDGTQRVNVIGHPQEIGGNLSFSIQDNKLIDHEEDSDNIVKKIHYRAPTTKGSSGSPVFNNDDWEVIGLHHAGSRHKMPKLNGKSGVYSANEAVWIQSIREVF